MADYIEKYIVPSVGVYGMEKHANGQYQIWLNGCGIGQVPTLSGARDRIMKEVVADLIVKRDHSQKELDEIDDSIRLLRFKPLEEDMQLDTHFLGQFLVTEK